MAEGGNQVSRLAYFVRVETVAESSSFSVTLGDVEGVRPGWVEIRPQDYVAAMRAMTALKQLLASNATDIPDPPTCLGDVPRED